MRSVSTILAAWVAALGIDLFLHACLFARLYLRPDPFLLEPMEAFRRIPAGYATFLIFTVALYWLCRRSNVSGALAGFRIGAAAGAVLWGAFLLGLWSFSTAPETLLLAWWIGQSVELAISGAVIGAAAAGAPAKRVWGAVALLVAVAIAVTIFAQSTGLAPPMAIAN